MSDEVRGSTLLLAGRLLATAVNFVTQVLIIRSLSRAGFGAFAFGLSVANLGETIVTLGLDRGVTRFVPIHEERGQLGRALGVIVFVGATVVALGVAFVLVVMGARGILVRGASDDATAVLVVLALLSPVQALDNLLLGLFAVFGRPGAIFVRRYVLAPGLRLAVVALLIARDGSPRFLAVGYVVTGAAAVAVFAVVLVTTLRARGLLDRSRRGPVEFPVREVLGFTVPLLTTDLVTVLVESSDALLLGRFKGAAAVATLRSVLPIARLNTLVLLSFGVLFTPAAARLFARRDHEAIRQLYWRTAMWVAVLSFPAFAVSVALARPLTIALFGSRYASSATVLAILGVGYFVNAAFGFNGLTLGVFGEVRAVVVVNVAAVVVNLALNLTLIPAFGAIGAAIGTASTLVAHNVFRQLALARRTGVPAIERGALPLYALMAGTTLALWAFQEAADPHLAVGLALAAAASLAVLAAARRMLRISDAFPTLARVPVLGPWLDRAP